VFTKDVDRGDARQLNPGAHHLISALREQGHETILVDAKHPLQDVCERPPTVDEPLDPEQVLTDPGELADALAAHPDLDLVCLTVLERSLAQVRELCRFIRDRSDAWIAVGGPLPTAAPEHCLVHLPEVDVLVRGDGETLLPRIAGAVAGLDRGEGALEVLEATLAGEHGLAARAGGALLCSHLDRINRVPDLDDSPLDFEFLERDQVQRGISLTTSRGCVYACRFCSVHDRQLWRAMSAERVLEHLRRYRRRLTELYGGVERIPAEALELQLWDDDFFVDSARAAAILEGAASAGHRVSFLQGTVASFFVREGRRITASLDGDLLDAIPPDIFTETGGLKVGTESFCDAELHRLGKPYAVDHVRRLVEGLARRGIRQDHYLVLCNRDTSLDDLLSGLETIAELRWKAGESFSVLQPSWLIHLFPTALYRTAQRRGFDGDLPNAGVLGVPGHPEFDYPFVSPPPRCGTRSSRSYVVSRRACTSGLRGSRVTCSRGSTGRRTWSTWPCSRRSGGSFGIGSPHLPRGTRRRRRSGLGFDGRWRAGCGRGSRCPAGCWDAWRLDCVGRRRTTSAPTRCGSTSRCCWIPPPGKATGTSRIACPPTPGGRGCRWTWVSGPWGCAS